MAFPGDAPGKGPGSFGGAALGKRGRQAKFRDATNGHSGAPGEWRGEEDKREGKRRGNGGQGRCATGEREEPMGRTEKGETGTGEGGRIKGRERDGEQVEVKDEGFRGGSTLKRPDKKLLYKRVAEIFIPCGRSARTGKAQSKCSLCCTSPNGSAVPGKFATHPSYAKSNMLAHLALHCPALAASEDPSDRRLLLDLRRTCGWSFAGGSEPLLRILREAKGQDKLALATGKEKAKPSTSTPARQEGGGDRGAQRGGCSKWIPEEANGDGQKLRVDLDAIEPSTHCPICLGVIKSCRIVRACLHRFCAVCIEQALRLGKPECPSCRAYIPSRRTLYPDERFDALIEALYGDATEFQRQAEAEAEGFIHGKRLQQDGGREAPQP